MKFSDQVEAEFAPSADFEDELEHAGTINSDSALFIGDVTQRLFEKHTVRMPDGSEKLVDFRNEREIKPYDIYNYVAKKTGKVPVTIADYLYVSSRVPPRVRDDYPMFFRGHWKAMCPHFDTLDELYALCEKILSWGDDYGGSLISVAALRHRLDENGNGPPEWQKRFKRLLKTAKMLHDDEHAPAFVRQIAGRVLKSEVPLP